MAPIDNVLDGLMCGVCDAQIAFGPGRVSARRLVQTAIIRGQDRVGLFCTRCKSSLDVALSARLGVRREPREPLLRCPMPCCGGFVALLEEVPSDHVGLAPGRRIGPAWLCGECGTIWLRRETLDRDIRNAIDKHEYRRADYEEQTESFRPARLRQESRDYDALVQGEHKPQARRSFVREEEEGP